MVGFGLQQPLNTKTVSKDPDNALIIEILSLIAASTGSAKTFPNSIPVERY